MIYLKNNTILQELYIPRQDYISNTTGSSGTYAEGYADGYESGYTSGSTDGFDSGYTEGYSSGETHQKGLLTSTEFTENGEYEREDGWSAVTINVSGSMLEGKEIVVSEDITVVTPDSGYGGFSAVTVDATEYGQTNYDSGFDDGFTDGYSSGSSEGYDSGYTEGYQSGSTDGFNSGYTSGETHQKSLLVSTAFTENGSYQRENGYSAITVNVPIPNIEANKEFTATTNGYYWVSPSSGSVSINDRFDSDDDCYYITATTSGYPLSGRYNIFYIEDEFDSSKGQIDVYIENGYLDYDDSDWDGGDVVDYETGDILRLKVRYANRWFDWVSDDDYNLKYDAMTGLGVIVDVPQTGETYSIEDTKAVNVSFTNMPIVVTPTKNNIQVTEITPNKKFSLNASSLRGINHNLYLGCFRDTSINDRYAGNSVIYNGYDFGVDTKYSDYPFTATTESGGTILTIEFSYPTFEWIGNGDGSEYDLLSGTTICFKPDVSAIDVGVEMSGNVQSVYAYQYGVDYLKGVVVSCENYVNSARTEAQNAIISTFTAMTATTNGVYGSSANPLSSITVNVPQSGSTEKDIVICTSGGCWFNMNYQIGYGDVFEIEHCTFGKAGVVSFVHQQYLGGNSGELFRIGQSDVDLYIKYFNNSIQLYTQFPQSGSVFEDNTIVYSSTAFTVDGNIVSSYTTNYSSTKGTLVVFANTTSGGDKVENQTAKIGRLKVYASDGTLKATFEPRLDEFNVPYFKYIEQDIDIYASGNTAPFYEEIIIDTSYQNGYTDGQNSIISTFIAATATTNGVYGSSANPLSSITVSVPQSGYTQEELEQEYEKGYGNGFNDGHSNGYNEGQNDVISTFTAITATTNGVFGSSANPLSSITVNVPQSSGDIKYVEYIETDGTQIGWDTGYNIGTDIDARIYLDFMPISGNGYGDLWFAYYGDGEQYVLFRREDNANSIGFMFGDNQSVKDESFYYVTDGNRYLISLDKNGITDENTGTLLVNEISSYINSTNNLWLNCDGNPQEISRCIIARYYGFRVENGNGETVLDMRPCLDGNDVPCFYDEVSQTYIYHQGEGTPVAGSVLPNPEYQSGYTDGYNSGHTDGYNSGYTDGYNSGYTSSNGEFMSYECLNSGAFYPQDPNNQNYSYKTELPDLLLGQTIVFEITKTSNTDNGTLIGGSTGLSVTYNTRDGVSLYVKEANSSLNTVSQTAYLTATYIPNSTASTITPRGSQKVTGKISIDSTGCTYGINCGGVYYNTASKSGTFRDSYPIVFNSSCSRHTVLNKITYFDNTTGNIIYCFVYKDGEIVNILDGTIAPTYDRNDNLVNGVLEEKKQD